LKTPSESSAENINIQIYSLTGISLDQKIIQIKIATSKMTCSAMIADLYVSNKTAYTFTIIPNSMDSLSSNGYISV
jgi:hypothetical protein